MIGALAIELLGLIRTSQLTGEEIGRLNDDAAKARQDAGKAIERANNAGERAGKFEAQTESFRRDIATAEQHAAETNRIAESERLARVRIEERLGGWNLNSKAQGRILERLKLYAGVHFDLYVNPAEHKFMQTLDGILISAGWVRNLPKTTDDVQLLIDGKAKVSLLSGITIEVALDQWKDLGKAATSLVRALIAEGFPAKGTAVRHGADPDAIDNSKPNSARVKPSVGAKAQTNPEFAFWGATAHRQPSGDAKNRVGRRSAS